MPRYSLVMWLNVAAGVACLIVAGRHSGLLRLLFLAVGALDFTAVLYMDRVRRRIRANHPTKRS
jgi:hypothetical protein